MLWQNVDINVYFLSREGVTTGVQQGYVLEPMLSTYNFRGGANSEVASLSNCIKLFRVIKTRDVCEELQEDCKKLSVKRHVQFNVDQCGVMDMGENLNSRRRNDGFCVDHHHFGGRPWGWNGLFYENSVLNSLQKPKQILEIVRKGTNKTDNMSWFNCMNPLCASNLNAVLNSGLPILKWIA